MGTRGIISLIVVAAVTLAACGGDDGSLDGDWVMVDGSVDGFALEPDPAAEMTLSIDGDSVSGRMACNDYSGTAEIDDGSFTTVTPLITTRMACVGNLMEIESVGLAGLERVTTYELDGDRLVLTGDGVEMTFEAASAG